MKRVDNREDAIDIIKKAEGSIPESKLKFEESSDDELIDFANYLIILNNNYGIKLDNIYE